MEREIFTRRTINYDKLIAYGFRKEKDCYTIEKNILTDTFKIKVIISNDIVSSKVYDLAYGDEYTNFRTSNGKFASEIKSILEEFLLDIREKCTTPHYFIMPQANRLAQIIQDKYHDKPNFEWEKFPNYATFKNNDSHKWYAIIMNIDKRKLGSKKKDEVEIINLKLNPNKISQLLCEEGFFQAYHMNKKNWITIILDDTISDERIIKLIDESYKATIIRKENNHEWLVPANPQYYDVQEHLKRQKKIMWKWHKAIMVGDIVYLYMAKPYSSIMYQFEVEQVNISQTYENNKLMQMHLLKAYDERKYTIDILKTFGVNAIRGTRYMPKELSDYIRKDETNGSKTN